MSQSLAALRIRENLGECSEPSQYAVGAEATVLLATPPTNAEIQEGNATESSPQWARLVTRLMGWTSQHAVASFTGADSASSFRKWKSSLTKFFRIWGVRNGVLQAKLAAITLQGKADLWWEAHCRAYPGLTPNFAQLAECISQELVPSATHDEAQMAWHELEFGGDVEKYLHLIDEMFIQFPISPRLAHSLACRPISKELVARITGLDRAKGGAGISIADLKQQIHCYLASPEYRLLKTPPAASASVHAAAITTNEERPPPPPSRSWRETTRHEQPTFERMTCWVCRIRGHTWASCQRRHRRGCAACGSSGHEIFHCPQ